LIRDVDRVMPGLAQRPGEAPRKVVIDQQPHVTILSDGGA
jgi:hypothetical protein